MPHRGAQPYEATADLEDNIWFPDSSPPVYQPAIGKFDPRDQTFTFYPKPQFGADSPKLQHTADGAVWFTRTDRHSERDRVRRAVSRHGQDHTLGAYPLNGPPGYSFKAPTSTR